MHKNKLIDEIQDGMGKLKPLMDLCKLPEGFYAIPHPMESVSIEYLGEATTWIRRTLETIYADWRQIRKQQTEERWRWWLEIDPESYSSFREVLMHKVAVQAARKHFFTKHRPDMFKAKMHKTVLEDQS